VHRTLSLDEHRHKGAFVEGKLRKIAKNTGATIIDPSLWLCDGEICETKAAGAVPIYCDESHLRASFVRENVYYLDDIVNDEI
jgi:hypothetical protein